MNVTLWVPSANNTVRWSVIQPLWNLLVPPGTVLHLIRSGPNNCKYSWNEAVETFLKTDDEWLLSVHDDVMVDPGTLIRLLSWNEKIVSALVFMRYSPVTPHIWRHLEGRPERYTLRVKDTREWFYKHQEYITYFGPGIMEPRPDDALVPVDFTSTSCMLIHRSVFEDMREETGGVWFKWDDDYKGSGEDRNFCEHAALAGHTTYVDRSCFVGHGDPPTGPADFMAWDYVTKQGSTPRIVVDR